MWNYRVVKKKYIWHEIPGVEYTIHEAYYNGSSVTAISKLSIAPYGRTLEELRECYKIMGEAFKKPVLDYDEIGRNNDGHKR